jgi:ArsR family transcriptional regulator, virulence genes transcriptional regulator
MQHFSPEAMKKEAAAVAGTLAALANRRRLMIICKLAEGGEASVTTLADEVGLSPSALSQHLSKLRHEGIVGYRRDGQTLWYRIADARIERLLGVLHDVFCKPRTVAR